MNHFAACSIVEEGMHDDVLSEADVPVFVAV